MADSRCMNCFSMLEREDDICPVCGWDNGRAQAAGGLGYMTELCSRYLVGRAKSRNGEGISYAAWDSSSRRVVEIREFCPAALARRGEDFVTMEPRANREGDYNRLLDEFVDLSRGISRLRELSVVVSVTDIFTENNTAYAVYEPPPVKTVRHLIREKGNLSYNEVNRLFMPVVTGLGLINSLGISHLGISPETLRVNRDGSLIITGFSVKEARGTDTCIDGELYTGYAALEQYIPGAECGESSDVYALASVMLYALTGVSPASAEERARDQRLMISKDVLRGIPPFAITAIANALQVRSENRTPSFERFRAELSNAPTIVNDAEHIGTIKRIPIGLEIGRKGSSPAWWLFGSLVLTLAALIVVASIWMGQRGMSFGDLKDIFKKTEETAVESQVPYMLGQNYEEWAERISSGEYDFTLEVSEMIFNETVEEGDIISQSVMPGDEIEPGGVIIVTVSRGKERRILPAVKGLSYEELSAALMEDGFEPVRKDEVNDGVEAGYVIRYEGYNEGDTLEYGSPVTIVVSSGPPQQ